MCTFQRNRRWKLKLNVLEAEILTASWQSPVVHPSLAIAAIDSTKTWLLGSDKLCGRFRRISRQIYPHSRGWMYTYKRRCIWAAQGWSPEMRRVWDGLHTQSVCDVEELSVKAFQRNFDRIMRMFHHNIQHCQNQISLWLVSLEFNLRISDRKVIMKLKLHFNFDVWFHYF